MTKEPKIEMMRPVYQAEGYDLLVYPKVGEIDIAIPRPWVEEFMGDLAETLSVPDGAFEDLFFSGLAFGPDSGTPIRLYDGENEVEAISEIKRAIREVGAPFVVLSGLSADPEALVTYLVTPTGYDRWLARVNTDRSGYEPWERMAMPDPADDRFAGVEMALKTEVILAGR